MGKGRQWHKMSDDEVFEYGKKNSLYGLSPVALEKQDNGYYHALLRRDLVDEVCKKDRKYRWSLMSDEEIICWGEDNGLVGLSAIEINRENSRYYSITIKRGLSDRVFKSKRRFSRRNWQSMSNRDFLQYAEDKEYVGKSPWEVGKSDQSFYTEARKRKLDNQIFNREVEKPEAVRNWQSMTDEEVIQYAKDQGYFGHSISKISRQDGSYVGITRKRGLIKKIFQKQSKRNWRDLSDEEVIQYVKEHNLYGVQISRVQKEDGACYNVVRKRGLIDNLFTRVHAQPKKRVMWSQLTDEELIKYAEQNDLIDKNPRYVRDYNQGFGLEIKKRDLSKQITKRKIKDWQQLTDKELIQYGIQRGWKGLRPKQVFDQDRKYYGVLQRRGLIKKVCPKKEIRSWKDLSDDEVIQAGKEQGYLGMKSGEVQKIDNAYYLVVRRRGLLDNVFVTKRNRKKTIEKFLEENPKAQVLTSIASLGYLHEVVDFLTQVWPERFPSYEQLEHELPNILPTLKSSLIPFKIDSPLLEEFYEDITFSEPIERDLRALFQRIGISQYQQSFNKDPRNTLQLLEQTQQETKHFEVQSIFQEILDFYTSARDFDIPGYGTLQTRGGVP